MTLKYKFKKANSQDILEKVLTLPVTFYSHRVDKNVRRIGTVAEEFPDRFGGGPSFPETLPIVSLPSAVSMHNRAIMNNIWRRRHRREDSSFPQSAPGRLFRFRES